MISFVRLASCCLALSFAPSGAVAQDNSMPQAPRETSAVASNNLRSSSVPVVPPRPPITPELRGDIYMARKMYREAIDAYRECPDSPIIENKIGIAFHQLMQFNLAKKYYQRSIKMDPKYSEAINNLGTIYYSEKSYKRAISYYHRALKYTAPSASIDANLGAAYFARKDYKRATEYYEEALQLDPDVFEHRGTFGTLMQEQNIAERATFHLYLAKMYAKSGANERAIIYLRKALEEGVKDREKIPSMPEFASLKTDPAFLQLLARNPKPL